MTDFTIAKDEKGYDYIKCHNCNMKSYNPNDIHHKFCGKCNSFHENVVFYERKTPVNQNVSRDMLIQSARDRIADNVETIKSIGLENIWMHELALTAMRDLITLAKSTIKELKGE